MTRGAATARPAVDGQDRRHGREAARSRHRRSAQGDAARRAALSSSLRRGVGHGDPVVGLCVCRVREIRQAAVVGEVSSKMETFMDPTMAPGQRAAWYPWPYVEGLTMAEATNELAFLVTGAYGKPVAKQMGAPLRLAVPWKYGFKSIKSIVRFTFTDQRPKGLWEALQSLGVRLLGQRQSGSVASALEPGDRRSARHRHAPADAAVQRLRRVRRRHVQGPGKRTPVGVTLSALASRCAKKTPGQRPGVVFAGKCRRSPSRGEQLTAIAAIWEDSAATR